MSFDVKGKYYVNYAPSGKKWDDDGMEEGKMPSGWFKTLDEAKAYAKEKAQKDTDGDTFVVYQPIHTVVAVPPDVTEVTL